MSRSLPTVTQRIAMLEAAIKKMQAELKTANGKRKAALEELIEQGFAKLQKLRKHVLH